MNTVSNLLDVSNLSVEFAYKRQTIPAIRDVSFTLPQGQTLALVGESGSGKSVSSLALMHLLARPGRISGGKALFRKRDGEVIDLASESEANMRTLRGQEMAMIFQEPMSSLNPLFTVGQQIGEMLELHSDYRGDANRQRVIEMLDLVEIPDAKRRVDDYPHSMSGGMRQRVMIAMAMINSPNFLIADEPTTALDVTIQAQILKLMRNLQKEFGMSILFITHDLGVVAEIADSVAVMYAGEIVEQGKVERLFDNPSHPYTNGLLRSIPGMGGTKDGKLYAISGTVPSLKNMPKGCKFAPRCEFARAECEAPVELFAIGEGQNCRCILKGAQ